MKVSFDLDSSIQSYSKVNYNEETLDLMHFIDHTFLNIRDSKTLLRNSYLNRRQISRK